MFVLSKRGALMLKLSKMTLTIKTGDQLQATTCNQLLTGVVIGFGEHKGRQIIHILADGANPIEPGKPHYRFVYACQIFNHNGTIIY